MILFVYHNRHVFRFFLIMSGLVFALWSQITLGATATSSVLKTTRSGTDIVKPQVNNIQAYAYYPYLSETSDQMCKNSSTDYSASSPLALVNKYASPPTQAIYILTTGIYAIESTFTWTLGNSAANPSTIWADDWANTSGIYIRVFYTGDAPYQAYGPGTTTFTMTAQLFLKSGDVINFPRVWTADNTTTPSDWCVQNTMSVTLLRPMILPSGN